MPQPLVLHFTTNLDSSLNFAFGNSQCGTHKRCYKIIKVKQLRAKSMLPCSHSSICKNCLYIKFCNYIIYCVRKEMPTCCAYPVHSKVTPYSKCHARKINFGCKTYTGINGITEI